MKVLGIDSALGACSVAVWDESILSNQHRVMTRGHVESLVPMVQEVVLTSGLDFAQLDLIAVSVGPGSFTGLRAGLATARGLGLALKIPVHGVTTLEAVAAAAVRLQLVELGASILVALETKRKDIFLQLFNSYGNPENEPSAQLPAAAISLLSQQTTLCGNAAGKILAELPELKSKRITRLTNVERPDAGDIAKIASSRTSKPVLAEPLYIHLPAANTPLSAGRLRP